MKWFGLVLQEVRVLRRLSQLQNMAMADLVNDTYLKVLIRFELSQWS
jgi:hypothetical protein